MKKELNFKSPLGDRPVQSQKLIDPEDSKELRKLCKKIKKKALRIVLNEESDFCDLDTEAVADHYVTNSINKPEDTNFMKSVPPTEEPVNIKYFPPIEIMKSRQNVKIRLRVQTVSPTIT